MATQKYEPHLEQQKNTKPSPLGTQTQTTKVITQEQREQMIAVAAYYLAENRHFQGGDPTHDWLQAQLEIDRKLRSTHT